MAKETTHITSDKPSVLANFNLGFEYNITWDAARKDIKSRIDRN